MTTSHPDIVMGQPIPEIQPRINSGRQDMARIACHGYGWSIGLVLVMTVAAIMGRISFELRIVLLVLGLIAWLVVSHYARKKSGVPWSNGRSGVGRGTTHWDIPLRDNIRLYFLMGTMVALTHVLLLSTSNLSEMFLFIGMSILIGGIAVIVVGFCAREPGQISCARCSYPLTGLTLPCMCPECGVSILDAGYTTDRPRVRSHWIWKWGVVLIVIGGGMFYTSFARPGIFYRVLPRSALNAIAIEDDAAFEELIKQTMTPEQKEELMDSLIERSEGDWIGSSQSDWLDACVVDGSMQPHQIEAVMEAIPPIKIIAPETGKVGEPVDLSLASSVASLATHGLVPRYYFRGFEVGSDPELRSGSEEPWGWPSLYADRLKKFMPAGRVIDQPSDQFVTETAGAVVIRARVVLVLTDATNRETFLWDEHGDGVFAREPMWMRTLDLECTIEVAGSDEIVESD